MQGTYIYIYKKDMMIIDEDTRFSIRGVLAIKVAKNVQSRDAAWPHSSWRIGRSHAS